MKTKFIILGLLVAFAVPAFAQRDTIRTMQLVGAKSGFIARPFLARSIWYGLLGSIIAIIVLAVATGVFNQSLDGLNLLADIHMPWYAGIAVLIIILGVVLSHLSTLFAVARYLRNNC